MHQSANINLRLNKLNFKILTDIKYNNFKNYFLVSNEKFEQNQKSVLIKMSNTSSKINEFNFYIYAEIKSYSS